MATASSSARRRPDDELRALEERIRDDPRNWIAQPLQEFSSIPTLLDGGLRARRADLRPFALTGGDTWVLPGGLTRVALVEGSYVVNSSQGGGQQGHVGAAAPARLGGVAMLSRVAENLYWLGRDLERVENIARMAEVSHHVAIEAGGADGEQQAWDAVLAATGTLELFEQASAADALLTPAEFLLLSSENPNSLRRVLVAARTLARELREQLSREVWEEINRIYLDVYATRSDFPDGLNAFCDSVRSGVASILGLFDNTVLMDEGRDWFRCGVYVERADMTSRIVDAKYFVLLASPDDESVNPVVGTSASLCSKAKSAAASRRTSIHGPFGCVSSQASSPRRSIRPSLRPSSHSRSACVSRRCQKKLVSSRATWNGSPSRSHSARTGSRYCHCRAITAVRRQSQSSAKAASRLSSAMAACAWAKSSGGTWIT